MACFERGWGGCGLIKTARAAHQRQSSASGGAFGDYVTKQRDVAPSFATKLRRETMMTAIKLGLVALVLFASAYVIETRAILALESSDRGPQVYEYTP
jgi:uncharacterized membrane protein (DUF4010 family)